MGYVRYKKLTINLKTRTDDSHAIPTFLKIKNIVLTLYITNYFLKKKTKDIGKIFRGSSN